MVRRTVKSAFNAVWSAIFSLLHIGHDIVKELYDSTNFHDTRW